MKHTPTDLKSDRNGGGSPIDPPFHHSTIPEDSIILYDDGAWSEGHYRSIFCLYLKALLENGIKVSAACPQPDAVRGWLAKHCPEKRVNCTFHRTEGKELKQRFRRLKPLLRLLWWASTARAVRRIHKADNHAGPVFFMNINHLRGALRTDRMADLIFPFPWGAFSYDSSCVRGGAAKLEDQFQFLSAKQCKAFGVTDEKMTAPMQAAFPGLHIVFLPDTTPEEFSETAPQSTEILRRANNRKIIGLLGMLHKRKGLLTALKLANARPDLFFLFAGAYDLNKLSPSEKNFVQSFFDRPPENCFCHLQRIEDEAEFNALAQLTNIIFAVYPGFTNSSGLLTKAGIFEKSILVAEGDTCMADRVKKYNLGLCVPAEDAEACSAALDELLCSGDKKFRQFSEFRADFGATALQTALQKITGVLLK